MRFGLRNDERYPPARARATPRPPPCFWSWLGSKCCLLLAASPVLCFAASEWMDRPMKRNAAVAIRLYSGWSYVSLRLGAEVVEYEESGACPWKGHSADYLFCHSAENQAPTRELTI